MLCAEKPNYRLADMEVQFSIFNLGRNPEWNYIFSCIWFIASLTITI